MTTAMNVSYGGHIYHQLTQLPTTGSVQETPEQPRSTMRKKIVALAAVAGLLLTGCGKATRQDRDSDVGNGSSPDAIKDTTNVVLYRNADGAPTIILFCVDRFAFASTPSSLTDGGSYLPTALVRMPELDSTCSGGKAQ